jgi:hypothetical protein
VKHGGNVSVVIKPDPGYRIASITDNGLSRQIVNPCLISNVTGTHAVVVTFGENQTFQFFDEFSGDKGWSGYEPGVWERGLARAGSPEPGNFDTDTDHTPKGTNNLFGYAIGKN